MGSSRAACPPYAHADSFKSGRGGGGCRWRVCYLEAGLTEKAAMCPLQVLLQALVVCHRPQALGIADRAGPCSEPHHLLVQAPHLALAQGSLKGGLGMLGLVEPHPPSPAGLLQHDWTGSGDQAIQLCPFWDGTVCGSSQHHLPQPQPWCQLRSEEDKCYDESLPL